MKLNVSREWCLRMAELEESTEIGAGLVAADPVLGTESLVAGTQGEDDCRFAFGRFVQLMRRQQRLTIAKLAERADIDTSELLDIEGDPYHMPAPRTVYMLAKCFEVPLRSLEQIAGLTIPKDYQLRHEAVSFAARSEPVAKLSTEENAALEAFVAVLCKEKS